MARQQTNTVEYFPHIAKPGKTLFILEGKYGNDGYAFWFKVLELLSTSEDHFYDCSSDADWQYLLARAKISDQSATEILDLLAKLGNIDFDLWRTSRVIWCQAFVNNLTEVYRKRKRELPEKPPCLITATEKEITATEIPIRPDQSATEIPQRKEKKSKVNNPLTPLTISQQKLFERFWSAYPNKKSKGQAEKAFAKINPDEQLLETMISTIERAKTQNQQWLKDNGAFIPHPATWLNARGWEDEITAGSKPPTPAAQTSPYVDCPKCGAEVLRDDFIEIGGEKYCSKCPQVREKAKSDYNRFVNMAGKIGKSIPDVNISGG